MTDDKLPYKRSACPMSAWLDIFGDKWSLLIVRGMMAGRCRYGELQKSPEGIPTNILASRLKLLEATGAITREQYSARPPRYEYRLTRRGADMLPVMQAMCDWSRKHVGDPWTPPDWFLEATPETFAPNPAIDTKKDD